MQSRFSGSGRFRLRAFALVAATTLGLVGAACSGSTGATRPGPAGLRIKNFSFAPPTLAVKAGQDVKIMNEDGTDHTVTADDGSFDTGHIAGNSGASVRPIKVGTVHYHCDIHTYMTGTLQVSR